ARPPRGDRRVRRRCPPRHPPDVRLRPAVPGAGAPARRADIADGRAPAHRRARAPLRSDRPGTHLFGGWADLVVFDPDPVDPGPVEWRADLPAGAARLTSQPVGMPHVVVNGVEVVSDGSLTGELPGRVLRRGRDTDDRS